MDEELLGSCEELRLDAVRGRAEREECFGEQEDEFLPAFQGWNISRQSIKQGSKGGEMGLEVTHEHGYSQTETANALASTVQRGLFLSRQTRPSWTAFGHRSKGWTLGA